MEFPTDRQVGTGDETSQSAAGLDDQMLAMDVADSLAARPELVDSADGLAAIYAELGIDVNAATLAAGRDAVADGRFIYTPPQGGLPVALAHLYVARRRWLPGAIAIVLALALGLGGYFFVYQPYADGQVELAKTELTHTIPAQLDDLYATVFDETKVQVAATQAAALRDAGKAAAAKGDRAGAQQAVDDLTALRDEVRRDYRLTVADRPGVKWGFWTFPDDNSDAANFYLVVDVRTADGTPLAIPVHNGTSLRTEMVSTFALRVPEEVYRAVEADRRENGHIDRALVGIKQFGFLDLTYAVDVVGGTLTRW